MLLQEWLFDDYKATDYKSQNTIFSSVNMLVISYMKYYAFFISTDDDTIRFKRPSAINISINSQRVSIVGYKKIPLNRITSMTVKHDVSDKELSAGKALGGAVLAGGVGMAVGAAMGGKKVSSVLIIKYANENGEVCTNLIECKNSFRIKELFDKYQTRSQPVTQKPTKPHNKTFKRYLTIYFTWPYQLLKKLTSR